MTSSIDDTGPERLREVAYHEAGHAIAAEKLLGDTPRITIVRRQNERGAWMISGECHCAVPASLEPAITVALAGAVAQTFVSHERSNSGDALLNAIARRVSPSDQQLMGYAQISRNDMDRVLRAVQRWWPDIESRAEREIAGFNGAVATPVALTARPAIATVPARARVDQAARQIVGADAFDEIVFAREMARYHEWQASGARGIVHYIDLN